MEVTNEEAQKTKQKDKQKRRSSILRRKSILLEATDKREEEFNETAALEKSSSSSKKDANLEKMSIEEPFDLSAYIGKLKGEIQDWKGVLRERKLQHSKLIHEKAKIEQHGQEVDLSVLTEKEKKFIEARPNYDLLMNSAQDLVDLAVKSVILNQHCTRRNNYLNSLMEEKFEEAKKKAISMVD